MFTCTIEPVDLLDDGMRLISRSVTQSGKYPIVSQENPELVAQTLFEKSRRAQLRDRNFRRMA